MSSTGIDDRVRTILINPRLQGLPYAREFSFVLFLIIIAINLFASGILSEANEFEADVPVNVLSAPLVSSDFCAEVVYEERVGYNLRSERLARGTKVFIAVEIEDPLTFDLADSLIPPNLFQEINETCQEDFFLEEKLPGNPPPLVEENYCLTNLSFAFIEDDNDVIDSKVAFRRAKDDIKVVLDFTTEDLNHTYTLYTTPLKEKENSNSEYAIVLILEGSHFTFDITLLPEFTLEEQALLDVNRITLDLLTAVGTQNGLNDFMFISLNTRFTTCKQITGLNTFQYFALLFDYAFFIEAFFTVFIALSVLKCMGFVVYNAQGKIMDSRKGKGKERDTLATEVLEDESQKKSDGEVSKLL